MAWSGWQPDTRVTTIFADPVSDFDINADLNQSLIVRRSNDFNDVEVIPFSAISALSNPGTELDPPLRPYDRVVILPLPLVVDDETETIVDSINDGDEEEEEEEEEALTRRDLIQPIIDRLKLQAKLGQPANTVQIVGAVRSPGEYPLLEDGFINEAISMAGGLKDGAYPEEVELFRPVVGEEGEAAFETVSLDLREVKGLQTKLRSKDVLRINYIPNWRDSDVVTLSGEFVSPGEYTISSSETLRSLIERAGGFTDNAFVEGARYVSVEARKLQVEQLDKIKQSFARQIASRGSVNAVGETNPTEAGVFSEIDPESLGRVVIDLNGILDGRAGSEVLVSGGDTLSCSRCTQILYRSWERFMSQGHSGLSPDAPPAITSKEQGV